MRVIVRGENGGSGEKADTGPESLPTFFLSFSGFFWCLCTPVKPDFRLLGQTVLADKYGILFR